MRAWFGACSTGKKGRERVMAVDELVFGHGAQLGHRGHLRGRDGHR
jgi:hypothetical protein